MSQNYRRIQTKQRKVKKGQKWTKMDKTEEDENGLHLGKREKHWLDLFCRFLSLSHVNCWKIICYVAVILQVKDS